MTLIWAARLIIIVTVIVILRQAAAPGPLLWISPTTGDGPVWAGGLKPWLGNRRIEFDNRRFGLAGALVVRQHG